MKHLYKVFILLTISFLEGWLVMAVELLGAKLIAPFYGSSLYVWSATLAVTLLALAIGYFSGAFLSIKSKKQITLLFFLFLTTSILIIAMPKMSAIALDYSISFDLKTGIVFSLICFIFFPLLLLGTTSPIIINELSTYNNQSGKNSGIVFSISTFGGIISTFIIGFYAIPNFGISNTCLYTGLISLIILIFITVLQKKKTNLFVIGFFIVSVFFYQKTINSQVVFSNSRKLLYKSEGILGTITVDDIDIDKRVLSVNNTLQTALHVPTKKALWEYIYRISTYSSLKKAGSNVLICGLGGGVLANEFEELGFNVDACDIDSRTAYVAKKYFYMSDKVNVTIDDARHFIKKTSKKYDVIVLDLSFGENIASNMYTLESFVEIKSKLNENGFVFLHFVNTNPDNYIVNSIYKTIKKSGLFVDFLNTKSNNINSKEVMYFATTNKINLEENIYSRVSDFTNSIFDIPKNKDVYVYKSVDRGEIFTDDKPVLDLLFAETALKIKRNLLSN